MNNEKFSSTCTQKPGIIGKQAVFRARFDVLIPECEHLPGHIHQYFIFYYINILLIFLVFKCSEGPLAISRPNGIKYVGQISIELEPMVVY